MRQYNTFNNFDAEFCLEDDFICDEDIIVGLEDQDSIVDWPYWSVFIEPGQR